MGEKKQKPILSSFLLFIFSLSSLISSFLLQPLENLERINFSSVLSINAKLRAMSTLMSPSEFSPLQQAFNSFLLSMPSEQLEELVEYLHAREAHQPRNQTGRGSQAPIEHPASGGTTSNARHGSVASTSATSKSLAARRRGRDKPLRPLNSFIAFRSKSKSIKQLMIDS